MGMPLLHSSLTLLIAVIDCSPSTALQPTSLQPPCLFAPGIMDKHAAERQGSSIAAGMHSMQRQQNAPTMYEGSECISLHQQGGNCRTTHSPVHPQSTDPLLMNSISWNP
jgi:hypothetical protein